MSAVAIERIAAGGDGVGRLEDGLTVFVPRTAPGDRIDVEVVERKRRYARGVPRRLEMAGPGRAEPRCGHYSADGCGGCQLQHLTPDVQLAAKRAIVGDAVRRIGKRDVPDPEIVPPPGEWRYRTKITLTVGGSGASWIVGLHRLHDPAGVFSLDDCLITHESLMELWRRLRAHAGLLPSGLTALVLREERAGGLHVVAEAEGPWDPSALAAALADPRIHLWWRPPGGAARVVAGPRTGFPVLAFEQANRELAARIREEAVEALGDVEDRTVWDLYGGVGDTAAALVGRGATVISVDADRTAVTWAERRGLGERARFVAARVEEALHRLEEPDAVIANPPRVGLHRAVAGALERWAAARAGARLCYVSCDPATLARDLSRLPSLELVALRAYDLFPQTSHVEALAVLQAR